MTYGSVLHADLAQHLVLDLEQVPGVEEVAVVKQLVGDVLRVGLLDTVLFESFEFTVEVRSVGHQRLRRSGERVVCRTACREMLRPVGGNARRQAAGSIERRRDSRAAGREPRRRPCDEVIQGGGIFNRNNAEISTGIDTY